MGCLFADGWALAGDCHKSKLLKYCFLWVILGKCQLSVPHSVDSHDQPYHGLILIAGEVPFTLSVSGHVTDWTQASSYMQESRPIKRNATTAESDLYNNVGFSVKITFFNEVISQQPNSMQSSQKHDSLLATSNRFSEINGCYHITKFNIIFDFYFIIF